METLSRRTFAQQSLGSLLVYSLLETLTHHEVLADDLKPIASKWLKELDELSRDVKDQKIEQLVWQQEIESLFARVDLPELLQFIDFEQLARQSNSVERGAKSLRFRFPEVEGLPTKMVFGKQIFALKNGRSVVPHGHNNMATAFLILKGDLRGRHYDRLEDTKQHLIIRPTIDRLFQPGECSTVSDYKDNVHWFTAASDAAYIFNIHVLGVQPGSSLPTGRVYVNPQGEPLSGGLIRAPRIGYRQATALFG